MFEIYHYSQAKHFLHRLKYLFKAPPLYIFKAVSKVTKKIDKFLNLF